MKQNKKQINKTRRAHRTRTRMYGTQECPRLSVQRSLKHISAQLINDDKGVTLASASDLSAKGEKSKKEIKPVETAFQVGKYLAEKAKAIGIETVVFDRGSYRYHGRIASLAKGARENGLKF